VYSDNGTNLVAGERDLRQVTDEGDPVFIDRFIVKKGTTWQFSPPSSPQFGGEILQIRFRVYSLSNLLDSKSPFY